VIEELEIQVFPHLKLPEIAYRSEPDTQYAVIDTPRGFDR